MQHAVRPELLRLAAVGEAGRFTGRDRGAEDAGQRAEQLLGQHRAARQLLAGEHGHVRHRPARLEQCLAAPGVVHPGPPRPPPGLVPLEERADVAQRHARAPVGPRVLHEHMVDEAVDPKTVIAIRQRLEHRRLLVPLQLQLGEGLGLRDRFAVDVRARHRVENVVELVVGWTPQPELAHREVDDVVLAQVVADHGRRDALGAEDAAVGVGEIGQRAVEVVDDQFGDRLPHIVQEPLGHVGALHRHPGHRRQVRHRIVAAPPDELGAEHRRPVLAAGLPTVDMEDLEHAAGQLGPRLADRRTEPVVELDPRRFGIELVAFQPHPGAARIIGAARGGVADPQHGPASRRRRPVQAAGGVQMAVRV